MASSCLGIGSITGGAGKKEVEILHTTEEAPSMNPTPALMPSQTSSETDGLVLSPSCFLEIADPVPTKLRAH